MNRLWSVLLMVLLWWPAGETRAIEGGPYDFFNACRTVSILGEFRADHSSYKFSGTCLLNKSSYRWTTEGAYSTKASRVDERLVFADTNGYLGEIQSKMTCGADPWLGGANCINAQTTVQGHIGFYVNTHPYLEILQSLVMSRRSPLTSGFPYDRRPLLMKRDADLKIEAEIAKGQADKRLREAAQPLVPYSTNLSPVILMPTAGQRFRNQTPVPIKLAPPPQWPETQIDTNSGAPIKTARSVTGYMVRLERKDPSGNWVPHTTLPVGAAQAETAVGYTGFGAGMPPGGITTPGMWRLSAQVSAPQPSGWSDWIEFVVMAPAINKALQPPTKGFSK